MSTKGQHQSIALDIDRFASVEEALAEAASLTMLLTGLAQRAVMEDNSRSGYDLIHAFLLSSVSRARGIADGISREIQHDNSHAVFALLRPLLEIGGLIEYVYHDNAYAAVLAASQDSSDGRSRVTWQKIWNVVSKTYPGIKRVYEEVCDVNHFGSTAFWMSWRIVDEETHYTQFFIGPGWREERYKQLAACHLVEFSNSSTMLVTA
ncbi:MAG: hypothetical protein ACHQ4F_03695 [Candidatus Dormibacteria bacterium]